MNRPLVSVIIPNYNYAKYLREAIDSVLAQTYTNIEIIVVDDGSADDSAQILKGYGDKIISLFQKNQGVSRARNNGVAASSGEYVAFLDADDAWLSTKIERQMQKFSQGGDVGLVHAAVQDVDDTGKLLGKHTDGMEGSVADELLLIRRPVILGGGSGVIVPRKIFNEIGGFDIRLSTSADWDLYYQITRRYDAGFVPEILVRYRFHQSNMHDNVDAMEHDAIIVLGKAFRQASLGNISRLRNAAYGNLHKVLAGSFLYNGQYRSFVRNVIKSLWFKPSFLGYYLSLLTSGRRHYVRQAG